MKVTDEPAGNQGMKVLSGSTDESTACDSPVSIWLEPLKIRQKVVLASAFCFYLISLTRLIHEENVFLSYELSWLAVLSVSILGISFIKARKKALCGIIKRFASKHEIFNKLSNDYIDHSENGRLPLIIACVAAGAFLAFRLGISQEIIPYNFEIVKIINTVITTLITGCFVNTLIIVLAFGRLIGKLSIELERYRSELFSWDLIEKAGKGYARTTLGVSFFSLCSFWLAVSTHSLIIGASASFAETMQFVFWILALAILFPMMYLFIPIWRLHRILVLRKDEIRGLFLESYLETERAFIHDPNAELAKQYLMQRQIIQEIENLPEWPFRYDTLAKVFTLVALPGGLFLFKEIIIGIAVDLIKR